MLKMKVFYNCLVCIIFVILFDLSIAQLPPRLSIPGALLASPVQQRPTGFRQARVQQPQNFDPLSIPVQRGRRPLLQNAIPVREVRPVIEEAEEPNQSISTSSFDDEVTKLGISALQSAIRQASTSDEEQSSGEITVNKPSPPPFRPERPVPVLRGDIRERPQLDVPQQQQQQQQQQPQQRPQQQIRQRQPIPQQIQRDDDDLPIRHQAPVRQQVRQPVQQQHRVAPSPRPRYEAGAEDGERRRKPVVQILRKYRTDNPDGSITWGYENEDGTFKEETLGIDCVTRGKYGYVDPDGVRREFSYETGNKCDEPELDEEEELLQQQKNRPNIPQPREKKLQQQPQFRPQPQSY